MADMQGATGEDRFETATTEPSGSALMPRNVRRWVAGGVGLMVAVAAYLIAVRGTAILFDLRDAVSAFCM